MVLEQLTNHEQTCDLCIVGSGPVGVSLALEFERLGRNVLVLESGGSEVDPKRTEDSRARIVDPRHHAPMDLTVCRALGGASWLWGGRCVPYDAVDFMRRDFIPESDWPIRYEEIEPWYKAACQYMHVATTASRCRSSVNSALNLAANLLWTVSNDGPPNLTSCEFIASGCRDRIESPPA
jgi:choline dehydrogenase-like flavoprotein